MAEKRESNICPTCGINPEYGHCVCWSGGSLNIAGGSAITKPSLTIKPDRPVTEKKRPAGALTVDIDCSNALKGLKAITREAKKAAAALKDLEEQQMKMQSNLDIKISTVQQSDPEELAKALHSLLNKQRTRGSAF